MPATLAAPGVYIEELPSGVRPIVGVSTSDTAFVDWFPRGPMKTATRVTSWDEFVRVFGGLHPNSAASYGVLQYFQHGGAVAWVVRAEVDPTNEVPATLNLLDDAATPEAVLKVSAANPGSWGNRLRVAVTTGEGTSFSLFVRETSDDGRVIDSEAFRNLVMAAGAARNAVSVVNATSRLITVEAGPSTEPRPDGAAPEPTGQPPESAYAALAGGVDATLPSSGLNTLLEAAMRTLTLIEPFVFNILCIPAMATMSDAEAKAMVSAASTFCEAQRAFLLVDPPETTVTATAAQGLVGARADRTKNAALYYPRLIMPDPLADSRPRNIAPSGVVAGIYARTDATRGVWKAPAGIEAVAGGVSLAVAVTESDSAVLNPQGINALRTLPVIGNVVWGARTLFGADVQASEWKYVPVRRTALFLEQSLAAGLKWVVFEPNDEPLWSQIRLNVGSFMHDLFRKGAFQGTTPRDAYFVRCDKNTTTQSDIDKGIVNILVGFAPLKPAEFVVVQIQQLAGQATA